jgi:hypothetical protein
LYIFGDFGACFEPVRQPGYARITRPTLYCADKDFLRPAKTVAGIEQAIDLDH